MRMGPPTALLHFSMSGFLGTYSIFRIQLHLRLQEYQKNYLSPQNSSFWLFHKRIQHKDVWKSGNTVFFDSIMKATAKIGHILKERESEKAFLRRVKKAKKITPDFETTFTCKWEWMLYFQSGLKMFLCQRRFAWLSCRCCIAQWSFL